MSENFILHYAIFVFFVITVGSLAGRTIVTMEEMGKVTPPVCEIAGWDALIDAVMCAVNGVTFFFTLMTISTEYVYLGAIIFTPLLLTLLWSILKLIRGGG